MYYSIGGREETRRGVATLDGPLMELYQETEVGAHTWGL